MKRPGSDYEFWLLDLDGTLVDVESRYVHRVMEEVGDRLGHGFTPEEAEAVWHGFGGERNAYLRQWGLDAETFWDVFHEVEAPETRAAHTYLYDDAAWVGTVDRPVGLVTHSQQYLTDAVLDRLDVRDWFGTVVCCDDDLGWKPDPAPVRQAMGELGIAPAATDGGTGGRAPGVLVGDGPQDVGAAWNAGLDAVHVERHGHDRRGLCVLGDHRVDGLDELRP